MSYFYDKPESKMLKDDWIQRCRRLESENSSLNTEISDLRSNNSRLDKEVKDLNRLIKISDDNNILAEQYLQLKDGYDAAVQNSTRELESEYAKQSQATNAFIAKAKIIVAALLFIVTVSITAAIGFALHSYSITGELNDLNSKYSQNAGLYNKCRSDLDSLKTDLDSCKTDLDSASIELYNNKNELEECFKKTNSTNKKKK